MALNIGEPSYVRVGFLFVRVLAPANATTKYRRPCVRCRLFAECGHGHRPSGSGKTAPARAPRGRPRTLRVSGRACLRVTTAWCCCTWRSNVRPSAKIRDSIASHGIPRSAYTQTETETSGCAWNLVHAQTMADTPASRLRRVPPACCAPVPHSMHRVSHASCRRTLCGDKQTMMVEAAICGF